MVTLERSRRVGRSQAASIFWGLVSVFFAAAACYYFWKYHENETAANVLRDQVLNLQEQRETLNSQKEQLQSNISETETQLKTREDFVQEKETALAQEESQIEAAATQSDTQSQQSRSQAALVKKFNDAVRKLANGDDTDVVLRGGRPVLRVPDSVFFDFGGTTLKPEGKALLRQIAQALDGHLDNFELRIDAFTDSTGEAAPSDATDKTQKVDLGNGTTPPAAPPAPADSGWELTGRRAGVLARYLREETSLPFQNVLVIPRADFQPIIPSGSEGHARNRRIEITITPVPPAFQPIDLASGDRQNHAGGKSAEHKAGNSSGQQTGKTGSHSKSAAKTPGKAHGDDPSADAPPKAKDDNESTKL